MCQELRELVHLQREENRRKSETLQQNASKLEDADAELRMVRQDLRESQLETALRQDKIDALA